MSITYKVSADKLGQYSGDVLVVSVAGLDTKKLGLPSSTEKDLKSKIRDQGFKGNWSEFTVFAGIKGVKATYLAVVGLGKNETVERQVEALRRGVAGVSQDVRKHGAHNLAIYLSDNDEAKLLAAGAVEGAAIGNYRFGAYSKKISGQQQKKSLRQVTLLTNKNQLAEIKKQVKQSQLVQAGVELTRDLVNKPANDMSPAALLGTAKEIAAASDRISLKSFNRAQSQQAGFTAFLAVAQGSKTEPHVMHLKYEPEGRTADTKKIFLVGKGITFDSGGINLKPTGYIETMKVDMAGAATVLGVFSVLAKVTPNVEVHGIIGACENMVSGEAYRPGDVIRAKNGKTIEIGNTDAEGRVTLADMLSYSAEQNPDAIIDLATLTGAAVVGLGETVAALFTNNEELKTGLENASNSSQEKLASLPMPEEYRSIIDSPIADLTNSGSVRWGGAITAALFLKEFVGQTPWAHLDIAGPAYVEAPYPPYFQKGATGWGVRTLIEYLKKA